MLREHVSFQRKLHRFSVPQNLSKIAFYLLEVSLHQRPTMQILCLLDNSKHTVTIYCSQYSMMNHQIGTDRHVYFLDQGYVKFLILWMVLFFPPEEFVLQTVLYAIH